MYYYHPEDREVKELLPGVVTQTFWGEKMLVSVVNLSPNTEIPVHNHPHEQVGIVIRGRIKFSIAGEIKTLNPGDVYVIPGDVLHGAQTFDIPVQVMEVFCPVREEYKY